MVAAIVYIGTHLVDRLNRLLLVGLVISYLVLVAVGFSKANYENLSHVDWMAAVAAVPILLICFGYQNLVPSLTYYLDKNVKAIRIAIIIGNLIPFFIYFLWDYVILGMLPLSHVSASAKATMVSDMLQGVAPSISILFFIKAFSLFAMLTSFLPSAVSFADFLKDGFQKTFHPERSNSGILYSLVFGPPLICALLYPHLFLQALSFAGGFIDVLLFGVLPAAVVLVGRNIKKLTGPYQVIGGNVTPVFILVVSVVILFLKLHGV